MLRRDRIKVHCLNTLFSKVGEGRVASFPGSLREKGRGEGGGEKRGRRKGEEGREGGEWGERGGEEGREEGG